MDITYSATQLKRMVSQERHHIPFFVMEFQGLSTGNVDRDAQPLRFMAHRRIPLVVAQNFDAVSISRHPESGLHETDPNDCLRLGSGPLFRQSIDCLGGG